MSNPYSELASLLEDRMMNVASQVMSGWPPELGTITDTGLKLDSFKHEIQDYLVADYLTLDKDAFTETTEVDNHSHSTPPSTCPNGPVTITADGKHKHDVITPKQLKSLKPGDRVLVIPVNGGNDFVIVARVVKIYG